jgi:hypothetical protein
MLLQLLYLCFALHGDKQERKEREREERERAQVSNMVKSHYWCQVLT